jgi:heat shock protein HslJ
MLHRLVATQFQCAGHSMTQEMQLENSGHVDCENQGSEYLAVRLPW